MATTTKPIILDDTGSRIALAIEHLGEISEATYTFVDGTNGFTVVPSGGRPAQTVTVTPSIAAVSQQASGLMSAGDKVKLDGIEANAEVNVQADWNEATVDSDAYIKNKPTIPTNVSQLTNDSNYATNSQVNTAITANNTNYVDVELAKKQDLLTAGNGISIAKDEEDNLVISNTISSLSWGNIDGTLANQTDLQSALNAKQDVISDLADVKAGAAKGATSIQPDDNISELANDAGYITASYHDATKQNVINSSNKLAANLVSGLATVATSGDYEDLTNTPSIPTVNDATLTIKKNGTTINSFSANASANVNVDIEVPTVVSDLTNDAGYQTSTQVSTAISTHNSANNAHADIRQAISDEASARGTAINGLQDQIDALTASSDVTDIVGTKAELNNYDTSKLHANEIIKVLQDESEDDAVTYYRWVIPAGGTGSFTLIGEEGPFYTKGQADAAFVPQGRTINGKALTGNITLTAADVGATSTVVNDSTVTIKKNGTSIGSFTLNKATASEIDISVPTAVSGTVTKPTFSGTAGSLSVKGTPAGSVTIKTATSGTANYTPAGSVSQPTFTGDALTSTGTFTPSGSVSITKGTGTANYTPEGSISVTPNIQLNTTSVNSITGVGSLPTLTFTPNSTTGNLTIAWSQGTLPTQGAATTVATSIKSQTASGSFTGTGVNLKGAFTGSSGSVSVSGTPSGTVSKPTFTGTGAVLTGSFSGNELTSTGSYTPAGTVSQPTFSGSLS